ncbi:MAG TPA: rhodanese-like domain-containing protein [Flavobacterium lutivivi]|nr:rhodanese-like domain-containing protein [Flavobacterium lutivivi]
METKIIKEVCPTSTQELIRRGYLLLDIREKRETDVLKFDAPKLLYIPMSEIEERYIEIPKEEKIVVVCETGERSLRVVAFLQRLGFTNLLNMKKGLEKWVQKGFPSVGDTSFIPEHVCCGGSNC